jgi:hypothetical protein
MNIMNKEKAVYAIQTFMSFLNIAKVTQTENSQNMEGFREESLTLLEKLIANKMDPLTAIFQLNRLIEQVNQFLKAPYPLFVTDTTENLVRGEIVAFEHYLNQELKANHLTVQEEAPLFNDSLMLWEKVGVSLTAKEGIYEFSAIVEKLNSLLPQEEHYPLPDKKLYE